MINRKVALAISIALALLVVGGLGVALAQGGGDPAKILRWTWAASSGGTMTSTSYSLAGTTGQVNTGLSVGAGDYIVGGIWTPHYISPQPIVIDIGDVSPPITPTIVAPTAEPPLDVPGPEEPDIPDVDVGQDIAGGTYFPSDLTLPGCPDLEQPDFPSTLNLPEFPAVESPAFPTTFTIPSPPTLTLTSYITEVFDPIYSLTQAILQWNTVVTSGLLLPQGLSGATGIGIDGFQTGGSSDINTFVIAGYTAAELADELVSGMDTALSYVRSVNSVGVIGPTAAAMVVGIAWIAFVAFAKIVIKALMIVVHFVVEIWRLLPFT